MDKVDEIMTDVSTDKDETQEDKIDDSVKEELNKMGWLWSRLEKKFKEDGTCFKCGCELKEGSNPGFVMEASGVDKGVYAVVILCSNCYSEAQKDSDNLESLEKVNEVKQDGKQ